MGEESARKEITTMNEETAMDSTKARTIRKFNPRDVSAR